MEAQGGRRSARAWVWVSIFVIGVAMGREMPLVEELLETGTSTSGPDGFSHGDTDNSGSLSRAELFSKNSIATGIVKGPRSGLCLDSHKIDQVGETLFMYVCDVHDESIHWDFDSQSGQLKSHNGICVEAVQPEASLSPVELQPCDESNTAQQWEYNSAKSQIRNHHGLCLDATQDQAVKLYKCDESNENQMFDYISVSVSNKPVLVDCQVSEWSEFGQCSLECGGGKNSRSRQVIIGRSVRASSDPLC